MARHAVQKNPRKKRKWGLTLAASALLSSLAVSSAIGTHNQVAADALRKEAYRQGAVAVEAQRSDEALFELTQARVNTAENMRRAAQHAAVFEAAKVELESARSTLSKAESKVTEPSLWDQLASVIMSTQSVLDRTAWSERGIFTELKAAQEAVEASHDTWVEAENARIADEKKAQEEKDRAAKVAATQETKQSRPPATAERPSSTPSTPKAASPTHRDKIEAYLDSLPGGERANISWNDPDLSGHLGAVWQRCGNETLMLNENRLGKNEEKTKSVVAHEYAHVLQNRIMCDYGGFDVVKGSLDEAFGGNGLELSADCVALSLGASWVNYTRDCSGGGRQNWVSGLLGGYKP